MCSFIHSFTYVYYPPNLDCKRFLLLTCVGHMVSNTSSTFPLQISLLTILNVLDLYLLDRIWDSPNQRFPHKSSENLSCSILHFPYWIQYVHTCSHIEIIRVRHGYLGGPSLWEKTSTRFQDSGILASKNNLLQNVK